MESPSWLQANFDWSKRWFRPHAIVLCLLPWQMWNSLQLLDENFNSINIVINKKRHTHYRCQCNIRRIHIWKSFWFRWDLTVPEHLLAGHMLHVWTKQLVKSDKRQYERRVTRREFAKCNESKQIKTNIKRIVENQKLNEEQNE